MTICIRPETEMMGFCLVPPFSQVVNYSVMARIFTHIYFCHTLSVLTTVTALVDMALSKHCPSGK
jgi:hypothetical protein